MNLKNFDQTSILKGANKDFLSNVLFCLDNGKIKYISPFKKN